MCECLCILFFTQSQCRKTLILAAGRMQKKDNWACYDEGKGQGKCFIAGIDEGHRESYP
jgi:hypothetical protein